MKIITKNILISLGLGFALTSGIIALIGLFLNNMDVLLYDTGLIIGAVLFLECGRVAINGK